MILKKFWIILFALTFLPGTASAFCGFYVAKADTKLFNKASQVVMVRDEDRTVLTMSNDFKGDLKEFAVVIPVPTFLEREQIHVTENAIIDHLDAYSAPRLVEYFDENPCREIRMMYKSMAAGAPMAEATMDSAAEELGVKIEASYTVGEYDIKILSAEQSDGLITWLKQEDYKIPDGAEKVVGSYLKQGMRFFVAKVNIEEQVKLGYASLRPIQVAYESNKFMLPIRLGMVNADGAQELFVYALSRKGRVETSNYRTVKLPTGSELPIFVKYEFGEFYKSMFETQTKRENNRAVFLEYAWDMNWCDPCAADPLSNKELQELGVFWLDDDRGDDRPMPVPMPRRKIMPPQQKKDVYITRLHVRYDKENFPEDLMFSQTGDRKNFQGRYILRHPWKGEDQCERADDYQRTLSKRQEKEAKQLANLTSWDINEIREKIGIQAVNDNNGDDDTRGGNGPKPDPWWKKLWKGKQ